jgi:predicted MPP superfamily phosphohydrolase
MTFTLVLLLVIIIGVVFVGMAHFYISTYDKLPNSNSVQRITAFNGPVVYIDLAHNNTHGSDMNGFINNLTAWGYGVVRGTVPITDYILDHIDILVISSPVSDTGNYNYTEIELAAIETWFNTGSKSIWIAGDSDYTGDNNPTLISNSVLNACNSSIYLEPGSVFSNTNLGELYRPLATNITLTHPISDYVEHAGKTDGVFFHGPCPVIGYNGSDYVPLEDGNQIPSDVSVIVRCNNSGDTRVIKNSPATVYDVHANNTWAPIALMAVQSNAGVAGTSKIVVTGEVIMSDYKDMFAPPPDYNNTHYAPGFHVDNYIIVNNTFHWMAPPLEELGEILPLPIEVGEPLPGEIFSFIALGDNRQQFGTWDETKMHYTHDNASNPIRKELIDSVVYNFPDSEFIIHTGDIVTSGGEQDDWNRYFEDIKSLTDSSIPIYYAVGNHEYYTYASGPSTWGPSDVGWPTYLANVDLPGNERYYSFDVQNQVHFVFINTDENGITAGEFDITTDQYNWLINDLDNNLIDTIVAVHHRPCYSVRRSDRVEEAQAIRNVLEPIYMQYDVDLVLNGHDHYYYRTNRSGMTYITTGGGGAELSSKGDTSEWQAGDVFYSTYHYCNVRVNSTHIQINAHDINGTIIDTLFISQLEHINEFGSITVINSALFAVIVTVVWMANKKSGKT